MKYSQTKPIVQESLSINVTEPEKIIIPSEMTRCGVLYVRSDMPSFQQTGVPTLVVTEKKYGPIPDCYRDALLKAQEVASNAG